MQWRKMRANFSCEFCNYADIQIFLLWQPASTQAVWRLLEFVAEQREEPTGRAIYDIDARLLPSTYIWIQIAVAITVRS